MKLEFKILSSAEDNKKIWDDFVTLSANGTIFHKSFWLDAWGGNYDLWGIYRGSELIAGLATPYKNLLGAKIVSLPRFTHYSGLLFKKNEGKYVSRISVEKDCALNVATFLKKRYKWGRFSFHPSINDMQPFIWKGFKTTPIYTYVLDVSNTEQLLKEISSDTRSSIRKAQKDGLTIVEAEAIEDVEEVVQKSYERLGLRFSYNIMNSYYDELSKRELCKGFICLDGAGNKIATYFIIWDEKRAYAFLSGYDAKKSHKGATSLCVWESIKFVSETLGMKEFDLQGSMIPQIERFNRNFGGKLTPYYMISWGNGLNLMLKTRMFINKYLKI